MEGDHIVLKALVQKSEKKGKKECYEEKKEKREKKECYEEMDGDQ